MNAEERAAEIRQRGQQQAGTFRLWAKDEWRDFPVWRVPVDALALNVDNKRFTADRKLMESLLDRELDPDNNPGDELSVISILLDRGLDVSGDRVVGHPSKDAVALRADWLKRGQETPFWIRPDGSVRNGNRRLAMVKRLRTETGVDGLDYVNAIILDPAEIDELDLFRMEQREQLAENFKVRYTDINLLLALREAANAEGIDWDDADDLDRVAGLLQHVAGGDTKHYAIIQLQAIRAADKYLEHIGLPGQYQELIKQVERLREVGKCIALATSYPEEEVAELVQTCFSFMQAGRTHGDLRRLRKMFREDRERFHSLYGRIDEIEAEHADDMQGGAVTVDPRVVTDERSDDDDDLEDADAEPPPPSPANYPTDEVAAVVDNAFDAWEAATSTSVATNVVFAANRLAPVTVEALRAALQQEPRGELAASIAQIVAWADTVRDQAD